MIQREVIEEVIRRNDIEQVIGRYVDLRRAGSNLVGLCPFHSEKTPSFTVFRNTDSFYCFGCAAGGNVITFIQKKPLHAPVRIMLSALKKRLNGFIPGNCL